MISDTKKQTPSQGVERTHTTPTYLPPVDIYEQGNALMVVADMPGVDEKTVQLNFENGVLTINGHVEHKIDEGFRAIYAEYKWGDYQRSFSVPEEIDVEKIAAKVKHGVLSITLPRVPKPQSRQIPVKID
jgi:HSP20 family molecular chaperone IbpA